MMKALLFLITSLIVLRRIVLSNLNLRLHKNTRPNKLSLYRLISNSEVIGFVL